MPTPPVYPPRHLALAIALVLGCADVSMARQSTDDAVAPPSETAPQPQTQPENSTKASSRPPKFTTMEGEWSRHISFSHKGRVAADTQFRNLGRIGAEMGMHVLRLVRLQPGNDPACFGQVNQVIGPGPVRPAPHLESQA